MTGIEEVVQSPGVIQITVGLEPARSGMDVGRFWAKIRFAGQKTMWRRTILDAFYLRINIFDNCQ